MYVGLGQLGQDKVILCGDGKPPCKYKTASDILAELPPCYSQEFDDCIDAYHDVFTKGKTQSSFCAKYYEIWKSSTDLAWKQAMDAMPYCSKAQIMSPLGYGVVGAAVIAGLVIGFALKKKS